MSGALRVDLRTDPAAIDALRDEWLALLAEAPCRSPALHPHWASTWWRLYAATGVVHGELQLLAFRDAGGRLTGLAPLYRQRRRKYRLPVTTLRWLSTGEPTADETCPDYLDVLARPADRDAVAAAFHAWLREVRGVGEIILQDVAPGTLVAEADPDAAPPAGWMHAGRSPRADLEGGLDALIPRLSSSPRKNARQLLRAVEREGLVFGVAATADEATRYYEELKALHAARWALDGKHGAFASPHFNAFHEALITAWVPEERAYLFRLAAGDRPIALLYGFRIGDEFQFYQIGASRDDDAPITSPGIALNLLAMRHLHERGVRWYDFLKGSQGYKRHYSTGALPLWSRAETRAPLLRAAEWLRAKRAGR